MALLAASGISKSYSARLLFDGVSFEIAPRDKVGLVGVNGCGKTTLFRILTGEEAPDTGSVMKHKGARMGFMRQNVENTSDTLYQSTVAAFDHLIRIEQELERISEEISNGGSDVSSLISHQQSLNERYEREGGLTFRSRVRSTLLGLGFTESEFAKPLSDMSGGERNKAQLAKLLLSGAELLLLDEPTNHLDIQSVTWLEDFLKSYAGAFIVISHDRYFLDRVTNRTLEIKNGRLTATNGNYSRHVELMSTRNEILRRHYANQKKEIHRLEGVVEQQRRWGQAHNFITAEAKLKQIERLKAELVAPEKDTSSIHFKFTAREVGGNDVLMCEELSKSYDKPVFKNASMHIRKGERVFLLGPNGCGKTSLFKTILNQYQPDSGRIKLGAGIDLGYYDQIQAGLDTEKTVMDEIWDQYPRMTQTQVRSALAVFLFKGDDVFKPVRALSGGEKAKVLLLKLMLSKANFLLLDEPTNHLDIASREALESALQGYEGTLFVISHDRYLINKIADRVYYLEPGGAEEYQGNYDAFLEKRRQEEEPEKGVKPVPKQNDYKLRKQKESELRKLKTRVRRAEEEIDGLDRETAELAGRLSDPETASDYEKALELTQRMEELRARQEKLMESWEALCQELEEKEAR